MQLVAELEKLYQLIHQRHCKFRIGDVTVRQISSAGVGYICALVVPKRFNMELKAAFRGGVEANALAKGILAGLKQHEEIGKLVRFAAELEKEKKRFFKGYSA